MISCSRRKFLQGCAGASALVSFSPSVPAFLCQTAGAGLLRPETAGTVLVVIQLTGGNDGLNTVVPYNDDAYVKSRPTLRLFPNEVHKINSELGFHPEMGAFMSLYREGLLSIVQGVGYSNSSRDHFEAMRDWHTGRPGQSQCQTGWLGRVADEAVDADPATVPAAFVGSIAAPFGLNSERTIVPAVRSIKQLTVQALPGSEPLEAHYRRLLQTVERQRRDAGNPFLESVRRAVLRSYALSDRVQAVAQSFSPSTEYPPFQLARNLQTVALLIRADLGVRIFYTELGGGGFGGFDNHANQRDNHAALLRQLAQSVAAFAHDLQQEKLLDRVLLMTFSEFGRTLKENGRRGTDHGAAAPMFFVGSRLKKSLLGSHPSLTDLDQGNAPKPHTDFRRLYATVLDRWLAFDSRIILGETFEPLPVV